MSLSSTVEQEVVTGNGTAEIFPFHFKIFDPSHLQVVIEDDEGELDLLTLGVDYTVNEVTDPDDPDQEINDDLGFVTLLAGPLTTGFRIFIKRKPPLTQLTSIRNQGRFFPEIHEKVFDYLTMCIQYLQQQIDRSFKVGIQDYDIETQLGGLVPGYVLAVNDTGDGLEFVSVASAGGGGFPDIAGNAGAILQVNADESDTEWNQFAKAGFSVRYNQEVDFENLEEFVDFVLNIQYQAPAISLAASGSGTIREKGVNVLGSNLSATVTKKSNPIDEVEFLVSGSSNMSSAAVVDTKTGTIPNGGVENTTDSTTFSTNRYYQATVTDTIVMGLGGGLVNSNIVAFTFVYPYLFGAGAVGLNAAAVGGLTKHVIASTATVPRTFTATNGQVFYFAYPTSYGLLTSILDENNFETFSDWTRTTKLIACLDTTNQNYYVYEFNNPVLAGSYTYTFKR